MPGRRHHPFRSRAQARLFFANPRLRKWAKKKEDATDRAVGGIKHLPERIGTSGSVPHGRPRRGGAVARGGRRRA